MQLQLSMCNADSTSLEAFKRGSYVVVNVKVHDVVKWCMVNVFSISELF